MQRLIEGFLLGGRYRMLQRLAAGGMGEVWAAQDELLGRMVAIKVLHPHTAAEEVVAQRFREEARNAAALVHPCIVTVFDYGEHDGLAYLVMEYVEGRTLSAEVRQNGPMDSDVARAVLCCLAAGLARAHDRGVVHRDVKPANVMLATDGVAKLMDFGIARASDAATLTRTGEVLGTPHYLSPEQALGHQATPASDLYALGIVAHELLTGVKPFDAGTPVATALAQINEPPPPLPETVPADLRSVVMACLAKDPADRPASASGVLDRLGGVDPATPLPELVGLVESGGTAVVDPLDVTPWSGHPVDRPSQPPARSGAVNPAGGVAASADPVWVTPQSPVRVLTPQPLDHPSAPLPLPTRRAARHADRRPAPRVALLAGVAGVAVLTVILAMLVRVLT